MLQLLIGGLLALMATGIPVAVCMLIIGVIYMIVEDIPLVLVAQFMADGAMLNVLIAIPLYLLTGALMNEAGVSQRIIRLSNALVGRIRGSLAQVNIVASMIFAGMTGEAVADTAALGSVLIPAMEAEGYDRPFSAAVTVASAVCGPIIPPSVSMIICAALAGVSVGRMFMGGMVPGLVFGVLMMITTYYIAGKRNYPKHGRAPKGELIKSLIESFWGLFTIVIILGGIFSGMFTPIEAGGMAAIYSFIVGKFIYRELDLKKVPVLCLKTGISTGVIMFIITMAGLYNFMLTREQVPQQVMVFLLSISDNPTILLFVITAGLFVIGCFLSTTPALMLTVPVLSPLVMDAGFQPIQFWVIVVLALIVGTITPPVGINLYLVKAISGVEMGKLIKELLPYYAVFTIMIILVILIPDLIVIPGNWVYGEGIF